MKKDKIENLKSFFADQVKELVDEQQKINKSQMRQLFKTNELSLAYIESVQKETGYVILKFPRYMAPRLKVLKSITAITKAAFQELGASPTEWTCHWGDFCENAGYHSAGSDLMPMFYVQRGDSNYNYVACSGISIKLYNLFERITSEGRPLSVIVHNPFPPVDFYRNMSDYLDAFHTNEELHMEPRVNYEDWNPEELAFDETNPNGIPDTIFNTLEKENCCIVQGPPGTGKSYTIASVIASYLENGKNVCVTTMANKGLVELIKQRPLKKYVTEERVSKTNLTIDERKQISGIKKADIHLHALDGELLCATNYALSRVFSDKKISLEGLPEYDLIVIEEASQAILTSIVAFKQLGIKCLIVGDPMQLPPIVNLNNPIYRSWNVNAQVEGLKTFALGSVFKSYRIVTTFRLTQKSAALTKLFYSNRFASVKKDYYDFSLCNSPLFPNDGGALYCCTNDTDGVYSKKADAMIRLVVGTMERFYPERTLAIVTPFRSSVKELQKRFSVSTVELDVTIETIDRIQGMTVDYAILYVPGRNPAFALEDRRFNVATSRSLSTTLIISDVPLHNFHSVSPTVNQFIVNCDTAFVDNESRVTIKPMLETTQVAPKKETQEASSKDSSFNIKVVGKIDLSKFERPRKELSSDKKNYYIIDTNVFVNYPDIINKIDRKYPIILSAKVTDELDRLKLKLDEQGKRNAEKALRSLNNEDSHAILYEFADVSLLPADFDKRSPDNMILSVALKYKDENPIMLTSDNGLQLKSKILGISTISLRNFLKR